MASQACLAGCVFHPELPMCRISKNYQPICPNFGARKELLRSGALNFSPHYYEEPWKPISQSSDIHFVKFDSGVKKNVFTDVQENHQKSVLFSFGIAEYCIRHDTLLQLLMSGSANEKQRELIISLLSDLSGAQDSAVSADQQTFRSSDFGAFHHDPGTETSIIYPSNVFNPQKPLFDLSRGSCNNVVQSDGEVLLTQPWTQMKDLYSIVREVYLPENQNVGRKQSLLVPHYHRPDSSEPWANMKTLEPVKLFPEKSPLGNKSRQLRKRKSVRKADRKRERDLYSRNYFHACESLLSIMMDSGRRRGTAFISMKKSGPELPELLTQFSVGIAGTGLAILFSVACKVACRRVPCASKVFNTGIGFALFWLSAAVNSLRDTIVCTSKVSGTRLGLEEEEMMKRVNKSVNTIFFRAAALMAVTVLRFA